jgi:hypothetical protein
MAPILFSILVTIVIIGFLWFYIARPFLEDFGIIRVNTFEEDEACVMSRPADSDTPSSSSSLETDNRQTAQTPMIPLPSRAVMLDTFRLLRNYGIPREEARPIIKALGLPLDNNLWTEAMPRNDALPDPPRVLQVRDNGSAPRAIPFDPDYPYRPLET